jgi:pyruvate/2-oxoglutarate dehydrogenase complex dihydrolipoamide acyltransferase (E2) component
MLIGCRFKRPKAPVELGDKTYFFTPIDPTNPDSEHVCDVTDLVHIQTLLGIPEGYYLSAAEAPATPASASRPKAAAPAAPPPPADPPPPPKDPAADQSDSGAGNTSQLPDDLVEAAKNLNGLSWQALQSQIKKGGIPLAVVQEALNIELAKPDDDQRATTIKILKQALGAT